MKSGEREIPGRREIGDLRRELMRWFERWGREYPWRNTDDPYRVLMAEMMLRRTKADQVKGVYEQFMEEYPVPAMLADARKKDVEKILYPLGLKWRTPAFQLVAREVKEKYNSKVPETREELKGLPGVGDYVAGAVLSVAYRKKEWIVDTNVVRVFKRYFGVKTSKEGRRDRHIIEIAKFYASGKDPRRANLAILDFSALVCTARNPLCGECSLRNECAHFITIQ